MENDLHSALPKDRYTVLTDRMFLVETTRETESVMLKKYARPAASDVGTTNPDLIVFGCTSAGSLFGRDYDAEFCATLGKLAGCPSLGVINAASRALSAAAARKIALITPYNDDLTASVANGRWPGDRRSSRHGHHSGRRIGRIRSPPKSFRSHERN
jgi:maleate isomerase